MLTLAVFLQLTLTHAWAIPESEHAETMSKIVEPALARSVQAAQFTSNDGLKIAYLLSPAENPRGTVVISPGRSESAASFAEWIYDLNQAGFSVAAIDHRGQGASQRLVSGSDVGHVRRFQDYVRDFRIFMRDIVSKQTPGPYFLLADSMGAGIGSLYMIEAESASNLPRFDAAALAAPMFQISTGKLTEPLVRAVLKSQILVGRGDSYAATRKPYDFELSFEGNIFTRSQARFDYDLKLARRHPQWVVGGASANWVDQAFSAARRIRANANRIRTPIVVFIGGKDIVVNAKGIRKTCRKALQCETREFPSARHWILMEEDSVRDAILAETLAHFAR